MNHEPSSIALRLTFHGFRLSALPANSPFAMFFLLPSAFWSFAIRHSKFAMGICPLREQPHYENKLL